MTSFRKNALDQELDINGSFFQTDTLPLADESACLGRAIAGQSGVVASITVGATVVVSGLTGMSAESVGRFLEISGASTAANNGSFLITEFISATSVEIANPSAVTDANNGSISWTERNAYSLEDDINYERSDRAAIKGVGFDQAIPTYLRCTDQGTPVDANLSNLAGKTTDAKSFVVNRKFEDVAVAVSDAFVTLNDTGNLKHADAVDRTGVPISDGADAGNDSGTFVEIIDGYSALSLYVLTGPNAGNRIIGRTRAGGSTSPDSVEVEFRSVPEGDDISTSIPYVWEAGQPNEVDLFYGYRECLDAMDENALRVTLVNGIVGDSSANKRIDDLQEVVGVNDGDTDLNGLLTNTTDFFPFSDLPDATPSVVEALNTLNEQIGDRTYTGPILDNADGYTITDTLQLLADSISSSGTNVTRVITRNGAPLPPGSVLTVPGGLTYQQDGTNNGAGMMVFWRGVLRDPGTVANGDDYEETSNTQITTYRRIRANDHINFVILEA